VSAVDRAVVAEAGGNTSTISALRPREDDMTKQRQNKPPKSLGRPKGSPNKTTALLKDAILTAATNSGNADGQNGLEGYLQWASKEQPGPFIGLLGKVLPLQLANDDGSPVGFTFNVVYEKPRE
jgi:hypothetical protein